MTLSVSAFSPLITSTLGQSNHYMTTRVTEAHVAESRGTTEAFRAAVSAQAPIAQPETPPPAPATPQHQDETPQEGTTGQQAKAEAQASGQAQHSDISV